MRPPPPPHRTALLLFILLAIITTIPGATAANPPSTSSLRQARTTTTATTIMAAAPPAAPVVAAAAAAAAVPSSSRPPLLRRRSDRTLESELAQHLDAEEPGLASVLRAIARATAGVAEALRNATDDLGSDDADENDSGSDGGAANAANAAEPPSTLLPRSASCGAYVGTHNAFGDAQLELDVLSDQIVFGALRACPAVASASSEETPEIVTLRPVVARGGGESGNGNGNGACDASAAAGAATAAAGTPTEAATTPSYADCTAYSVAFDPLDGSSIVGANMAVGSIFGVWRGATPLGQRGGDQAAAAYALFGPRTLLVLARPRSASERAAAEAQADAAERGEVARRMVVQQFVWVEGAGSSNGAGGGAGGGDAARQRGGEWRLSMASVRLDAGPSAILAPANLRAAASNPRYKALVDSWIAGGGAGSSSAGGAATAAAGGGAPAAAKPIGSATLRYSGGMVPDVHHVLSKRQGLFLNPTGEGGHAPAKLRLLYECAPLAMVVEAAGGRSTHDGAASLLELRIVETNARTAVALGSREDVAWCSEAMRPV